MNALAMDYNSIRSFTMTLAHRAWGYIRRGGFRQLRNYVDMCATLAKNSNNRRTFLPTRRRLCSARTAATTALSTVCWIPWMRIASAPSASIWALAG